MRRMVDKTNKKPGEEDELLEGVVGAPVDVGEVEEEEDEWTDVGVVETEEDF